VNTRVGGFEVDFVWARAGVVVEVDGYAYHRSPEAMTTDHERDVALVLSGFRVLRFTWHDVTKRASYVAKSVRRALAGSLDRG
jgi:very-short-patch-repair endonuclease